MKTGQFESGIAQSAAKAALMRNEPTQREPTTFYHYAGRQRLVGTQDRPRTGCTSRNRGPLFAVDDLEVKTGQCAPRSNAGRASQCAPLSAVIEQGLLAGLSAQRIYQDLVAGHAFTGGYDAVKRFMRRLALRT